jgi:hypothetical protein
LVGWAQPEDPTRKVTNVISESAYLGIIIR